MVEIYIFMIGICIASFINVVIWRVPQGLSVFKGRSFCPNCRHTLNWMELIPILSFIMIKGKCVKCHHKLSLREPWIELLGGVLAILCLIHYGTTLIAFYAFVILMVLLAISIIDMDTMTIPNGLLIALLMFVCFYRMMNPIALSSQLLGFFIIALPMIVLNHYIKDCFGGGDIKLCAVAGLLLGWSISLVAFFIAILIAGCYATYLLLMKKTHRKAHIAFGPYLCFGIAIALFYGEVLLQAYVSYYI